MAEKAQNNAVGKTADIARKLHGTAQIVRGAVTADFVAVVNGVTKVLSPQVIAAIIGIAMFFVMLPVLIIFSIPQVLFNWGTLEKDAELMQRHEYATEILEVYNDVDQMTQEYVDSLTEGVGDNVTVQKNEDNVLWIMAIDAVRNKQDIMEMDKASIKELIKKSYVVETIDNDSGGDTDGANNSKSVVVRNKSPDELMDELGFDDEQKNWATLMVKTVKDAAAAGDITLPNGAGANGGGMGNNGIPAEAYNDETFRRLINEAEKYLGYPYVFGGSSPSTSFDCSGFVCWVYTHSGVHNLPRTTAQGIYNQCTRVSREEAKPGDLVFFQGTYNAGETVTHIGIYVGNNRMLHCGSPIQYTSIDTTYWRNHFYNFGRLN